MSLPQLLFSRAFSGRPIVLVSDSGDRAAKEETCARLVAAGYQNVTYVAEPLAQLEWHAGRLVRTGQPIDHAIKVITPLEAHRLLAEAGYVPVVVGEYSKAVMPPGFIQAPDNVEKMIDEESAGSLVMFASDARKEPTNARFPVETYWVEGGLEAWMRYQSVLLARTLQRNQRFQVCGG